ncbi:GFA family protein [Undibacterium terreum]|uniref:Aldehyde-activating protein n=1 Tax=Undibacterium terreum TaxID=1224302 RepID=A0A916UB92_9BURK|nr:GFA family protein [Undibacterium terreum]GGC65465.1 aldehyde-activating protein [Undibacterium terreum]
MNGACHCGAIRYEITGAPFAADFCHCRDCQKTTGAPVGAWMDFKAEQVRWLQGNPTEYASSATIRRGFCPQCGSTLSYRSTAHPQYLTLSITSLDSPDAVRPTYHIYTDSQVKWLTIDDDCERYPKGK